MADYTITNLRADVEDMAPKFGMSPEVEARFARDPLESQNMALSYQHLAPNVRAAVRAQARGSGGGLRRLEGGGQGQVGRRGARCAEWDADSHRAAARCGASKPAETGITLIAFGAPKTASNDAEMVQGWWSDYELCAPRSAVAHTSSGCGPIFGIAANSRRRSFSLFCSNTPSTVSCETGSAPPTPTSWSVTIEMFA